MSQQITVRAACSAESLDKIGKTDMSLNLVQLGQYRESVGQLAHYADEAERILRAMPTDPRLALDLASRKQELLRTVIEAEVRLAGLQKDLSEVMEDPFLAAAGGGQVGQVEDLLSDVTPLLARYRKIRSAVTSFGLESMGQPASRPPAKVRQPQNWLRRAWRKLRGESGTGR